MHRRRLNNRNNNNNNKANNRNAKRNINNNNTTNEVVFEMNWENYNCGGYEPGMQPNNGGGFCFEIDDLTRLQRFLCMGSEGGTYYQSEKEIGLENMQSVLRLLAAGRGLEVVEVLRSFSVEGRTAKQQPLMLCLAVCARLAPDAATRQAAYAALPQICRIPTHLFMFLRYSQAMSCSENTPPAEEEEKEEDKQALDAEEAVDEDGKVKKRVKKQANQCGKGWGRRQRHTIANWYNEKSALELARLVTKYPSRETFTHRDVLRLAHPKAPSTLHNILYQYITKQQTLTPETLAALEEEAQPPESNAEFQQLAGFLRAVHAAKVTEDAREAAVLIAEHDLAREHINTVMLNHPDVWAALLVKMPLTALVRNLGKMSQVGLFHLGEDEGRGNLELATAKLGSAAALQRARLHPFALLTALYTYKQGHGDKGKLTWPVNEQLVLALEKAFYASFKNVQPTGQRVLLAVDVSGSMGWSFMSNSQCISARDAAACMAMVFLQTEQNVDTVAFSSKLSKLPLRKDMRLDQVIRAMDNLPFGATDCAQPMQYALKRQQAYDLFVVLTDCETNCGIDSPAAALREYRRHMNLPHAKLAVLGFTASKCSIADPNDGGMMDFAGFDSGACQVLADFARGEL